MPVTDIELMLRIQTGDEEAFAELWERYASGLLKYFYWYGLVADEADDGVQETFQRLWQAREKYSPSGHFRSYLYRIATNYLIDRARASKRRPTTLSIDAPFDDGEGGGALRESIAGNEPGPDSPMDRRETADAIQKAVNRLPEGQRIVFLLGVQEGVKYTEIGEILGIPEGTVKSRMHSAVHALRTALSRGKTAR